MSVVQVTQRPERRGTVESQRNGLLYEVLGRKYILEFNVICNTFRTSQKEVLLATGIPQIGDTYTQFTEVDTVATCTHVEAIQDIKSRLYWKVTATFDTDRLVSMVTDNPLNQPPLITYDFTDYEKPLVRDAYGTPLVSSAGNPFDPPFMAEKKKGIIRIVRNEATYSNTDAKQYIMTLNAVAFGPYDPGFARMNSITGHQSLSNGILFYQVTYEIETSIEPDGHLVRLLDADFRDKDGNLFRDKLTFEPLTNITPLNGKGYSIYKSVSTLADLAGINDSVTAMTIPGSGATLFPPALATANSEGFIPGPYGNYQLRIDSEVVNVVGGHGTTSLTIERGYAGTTPAAHAYNAVVKLEPYYLRYIPIPGPKSWTALALPAIT